MLRHLTFEVQCVELCAAGDVRINKRIQPCLPRKERVQKLA